MKYVLLDFDCLPIRYFNYRAKGTVKVKVSFDDLLDKCGECLF